MVAVRTLDLKSFQKNALAPESMEFLKEGEFAPAGPPLPPEPEPYLGKSVSTLTGATGNTAIKRPKLISPFLLGTHTQNLTIISTFTELERYLSFTSSGSGLVYGVQINGASSYLERERNVQYAMYAVVRVSARTHFFAFNARELREICRQEVPPINEDLKARQSFYEKWGDAYVQKVIYGGELIVVIELTRNSYSYYQAVKHQLSGNYAETYKGSAEYEATRSLIMKKGQVKATVLIRGRNIAPPIAVSAKADETVYDAQALFNYADDFGSKVRKEDVAEAMEFELVDLKKTDNWPMDVNPISVDDAVYRDDRLIDLLIEAEKLQIQWTGFIEQPTMYEIEGARDNPDLITRRRTEAQRLMQDMQGVLRGIREERRELERQPLAFDREKQRDWEPAFLPYRLVPLMKRTIVPTIVTQAFQIKFNPASGRGLAPNVNKTYTVDASNSQRRNWFPAEGTGRLQFVNFLINFGGAEKPLDLGLEYQVRLMEVGTNVNRGVPTGRIRETQPVALGQRTEGGEDHRVWEVRFRLTGLMKDAYYLEYQVHAGEKRGTGAATAGNTNTATHPEWTYLGNGFHLEGIRLAIFPKSI